MDSLFASLFARDRQIEDADEESDSENASFSYFPPKDRPICRDVPVKETVRLKLDKVIFFVIAYHFRFVFGILL